MIFLAKNYSSRKKLESEVLKVAGRNYESQKETVEPLIAVALSEERTRIKDLSLEALSNEKKSVKDTIKNIVYSVGEFSESVNVAEQGHIIQGTEEELKKLSLSERTTIYGVRVVLIEENG